MLAPVLLLNISMTGRSHAQRARDAKLKGSSSCKCAMFCIVDVGALPEIPVMFFGLISFIHFTHKRVYPLLLPLQFRITNSQKLTS